MEKIVVKGVKELRGEVDISCAKNSILPIITATILCPEPIVIDNAPRLEDVEVIDIKIGARASSVDYFPMVGKFVDSKKSIEKYPHIKNGTHIKNDNLIMIDDLYVLNGVGGRGFVLSLYLANQLVQNVISNKALDEDITNYRLFSRWAKKQRN